MLHFCQFSIMSMQQLYALHHSDSDKAFGLVMGSEIDCKYLPVIISYQSSVCVRRSVSMFMFQHCGIPSAVMCVAASYPC